MTTGLGPLDLVAVFSAVFGEISMVRASRGLPALTSTHLGAEWVRSEEDAPRIVIVPTECVYAVARGSGNQNGLVSDFSPKPLYRRLMQFDALCWGDDLPGASTESASVYSFNSAIELERELIVALAHNLGGMSVNHLHGSKWDQPTDMVRRGRLIVLTFSFETPVTQEPYIVLPYSAEAGGSGVQFDVTMIGGSTTAGVMIIPP